MGEAQSEDLCPEDMLHSLERDLMRQGLQLTSAGESSSSNTDPRRPCAETRGITRNLARVVAAPAGDFDHAGFAGTVVHVGASLLRSCLSRPAATESEQQECGQATELNALASYGTARPSRRRSEFATVSLSAAAASSGRLE